MGRPLKVLMIENSEDDAVLAAYELQRAGYDLTSHRVETGPDLAAALARETWDLILSDYNLPGFSGLHALHIVKDSGLNIPFLLRSGTISEGALAEALRAGAHGHVSKDRASVLAPAVEHVLRECASRSQLRGQILPHQ
jgi:phosphoserine phosphatase RsbU/P